MTKKNHILPLRLFIFVLLIALAPSLSLAAARTTPFSPGETTDPGTATQPCGPSDANCFPSVIATSTTNLSITYATTTNLVATNATTTNSFISNLVATALNAVTGIFTNLTTTNASTTNLTVGSLNGLLVATNGSVSSVASVPVTEGGTGTTTAPGLNQLLIGNGAGGYAYVSTSSLGIGGGSATTTVVSPDGSLSVSSTATSASVTLNTSHANTWTGGQTFGNATATNLVATNASVTNATSTNGFFSNLVATVFNAITATFTNLVATNATSTNLVATNATSTNLSSTNATSTNSFVGNLVATALNAVTGIFTNLTTTNASTTNLTVGNLNGLLIASNGAVSSASVIPVTSGGTGTTTAPGLNQLLIGNGAGGYAYVSTSSLGISGGSSATTTVLTPDGSLSVSSTATSASVTLNTNHVNNWIATQSFNTATATNLVATNGTSTNFFATALSAVTGVFTNISDAYATDTNLVSTNSSTTNATSTNLTARNSFTLGSNTFTTLLGSGLQNVNGSLTVSTSTIQNDFSAGTGLSYNPSTGTFTNTGVTSLLGTANQITVSNATGTVTLSLPSSVTIPSLTVSNLTLSTGQASPTNIVAYGDSLTEGINSSPGASSGIWGLPNSYPGQLQTMSFAQNSNVYNLGISGWRTSTNAGAYRSGLDIYYGNNSSTYSTTTATWSSGAATLTITGATTTIVLGESIGGVGIPVGATITSTSSLSNVTPTITISAATTAAGSNAVITYSSAHAFDGYSGTAHLLSPAVTGIPAYFLMNYGTNDWYVGGFMFTANSYSTTNVDTISIQSGSSTASTFAGYGSIVGDNVFGPGILPGTTVTANTASSITLSQAATSSNTGGTYQITPPLNATSVAFPNLSWEAGYTQQINDALADGYKVVVLTLHQEFDFGFGQGTYDQNRQLYNQWLLSTYGNNQVSGVTLVDLTQVPQLNVNNALYTNSIHLTNAGYLAEATYINTALASTFPTSSGLTTNYNPFSRNGIQDNWLPTDVALTGAVNTFTAGADFGIPGGASASSNVIINSHLEITGSNVGNNTAVLDLSSAFGQTNSINFYGGQLDSGSNTASIQETNGTGGTNGGVLNFNAATIQLNASINAAGLLNVYSVNQFGGPDFKIESNNGSFGVVDMTMPAGVGGGNQNFTIKDTTANVALIATTVGSSSPRVRIGVINDDYTDTLQVGGSFKATGNGVFNGFGAFGGNVNIGTTTATTSNFELAVLGSTYSNGTAAIGTSTAYGVFQVNSTSASLIPVMTSNTAPYGVASCSTNYALTPCSSAFIGSTGGWLTNSVQTGTLEYQFPSAQFINSYTIIPWSADTQPATNRSPKTWTFQGSNDGSTWTTLDTQTNYTSWATYVPVTFPISNPAFYTYYRLNITANGGNNYMGIQYLGMSGGSAASFNVLQNGNIGVGTTTPWASLSIQGGLDPYDLLDIASSTSATTAARVFTILANGKVGIGTSTPTTTLDVAGDITDENIKNCDSSSQSIGTDLNGKLVCNTSLSDERLKNDITTLDASSTLAAINQLNPVSFYWKDNSIPGAGSTQEQFGFIAQDVENIFPNLVGTTTATTTLTPDFTYYLNYQGFIALAVKGIQALSAEVAGLQTQVAALQASVVAGGTNAANALGDFFANRIHTQTLCIGGTADGGETCITRSQLDALLQSQGLSGVISNGAVPDAPSASSTPSDSSSTSTDSTDASSTPDQSSGTSTPDMSASSTPTVSDSSDASDTIATSTTS